MRKEFNLKEKVFTEGYVTNALDVESVKEFIRRLKELSCMDYEQINEINKLSGGL